MADKNGNKTGGRQKGVPNKLTATVKDVFTSVFNKLQEDPEAKLEIWGKENPTDFYKLCSKLIPTAIEAKVDLESNIAIFQIPDNDRNDKDN